MSFRALSRNDLNWFLDVRNSARKFLHDQTEFTINQTLHWYESGCGGNQYFIARKGLQDIGYVRISNVNPTVTLIGLDIAEEFRGKGLAKEIYRTFAKEFSKVLLREKVALRVLKTNQRAINLYIKLGFKITEETPQDYYMEILRNELAV